MIISLIAAMDKNRLIGNGKEIPWHLPADFAYFKQTTMGHPVIMGATTYESIGKALPGRKNIVLSIKPFEAVNVEVADSLEHAFDAAKETDEVFVIGGASVYKQTIDRADKLYVTHVEGTFVGDVYFPEINFNEWKEIKSEERDPDEKNSHRMRFVVYERVR